MSFSTDELSAHAQGGTELMKTALQDHIAPDLLDKFHITVSRFRGTEDGKIELLWLHDLESDRESQHLSQGGWNKFERLIFVSHWQFQRYQSRFGIPWHMGIVIQNAIEPIKNINKPKNKITLIYHTTPHRGLEILVPVFDKLCRKYENIELDVFSSFKAYGWEQRDKPYKGILDSCRNHPKIHYHGFQPNSVVREALSRAHIFAYPSIWPETSCIALMEAMSAQCLSVHPNYGALPETAANWTWMYQWVENKSDHAALFLVNLDQAIQALGSEAMQIRLQNQKSYADIFYSWDVRKHHWNNFLKGLL